MIQCEKESFDNATALHVVSTNNIQAKRSLGRPLVFREHSFVALLQDNVHGLIKPLQIPLNNFQ